MAEKTRLLMSANRPLLAFEPSTMRIVHVFNENSELLSPIFSPQPTSRELAFWLSSRISPLGHRLLARLAKPCSGLLGALETTLGLSLNDVWWISDGTQAWKDVNLYDHAFAPDVSQAALADDDAGALLRFVRAPEWSTPGDMAKCWRRQDGKPCLVKRDEPDGDGLCQTVKEWFAWQVAEAMGLECVRYSLCLIDGSLDLPVCECESFTDAKTGFLPASIFLLSCGAWSGSVKALQAPRMHDSIAEAMGQEFYEDMMVFDALIGNTDRHLGNFGMLFDTATGEVLRPAPLFDHGASFDIGECCWLPRWLQLETFLRPRHEAMLEIASRIELRPHPEVFVSQRAVAMLQDYVWTAARQALDILHQRHAGL